MFSCFDSQGDLLLDRERCVEFFQCRFQQFDLKGSLVFDGNQQDAHVYYDSKSGPLNILFSPHHLTADLLILEYIQSFKVKSNVVIVTNDTGLKRNAAEQRVNVMSNEKFLFFLHQKETRMPKKNFIPNPKEMKRWLDIFEDLSRNGER